MSHPHDDVNMHEEGLNSRSGGESHLLRESFAIQGVRLKRLSRIAKLDLSYYLPGGFWITVSRMLQIAMIFLLSVIFARFSSKVFYGQYKLALSVFATVTILTLPGMKVAIQQSVARGFSWSLIRGMKVKLKWSLLAWPILGGVAAHFIVWQENPLGWAFLLGIPFFVLTHVFENEAFLVGRKRFKANTLIHAGQCLLLVVLVSCAIMLFQSVILAIIVYFLSYSLTNVIVYRVILREIKDEPDVEEDPGLIRYGKHLTAMVILTVVTAELDRLLISAFLGFQAVAVYAIAQGIPEGIMGFSKQIKALTMPRFAVLPVEDVFPRIRSKRIHLLGLGGLGTVALCLTLPHLIPAIYSSQYEASVLPAQILSLTVVFIPLRFTLMSALMSQRRTRELYFLNTLYPVTRMILLAALIPLLGVAGAALSELLSYIAVVAYGWFAVKRMSHSGA
jgi:O-antigen/teichoic acid export membrane protein